jgi:leucyl-tRNA synthetase
VQGAWRFVQRVWRLVNEVAGKSADSNVSAAADALDLRRIAHRALAAIDSDVERLAFNRCVAHAYTLANGLGRALDSVKAGGAIAADLHAALNEATAILVQVIAPMMPHLAEECWGVLGRDGLVADRAWPVAKPSLLADDTITLPVQINGKKRADVTVARDASPADVEAATLALDSVIRALDGKPPKKIIVVPQRIVNVVA